MTISFRPLFEQLVAEQVEIVLVGGFAAVSLGVPYITQDVDLCYDSSPANLSRLIKALAPLHPRLRVSGMTDEEAAVLPFHLAARRERQLEALLAYAEAGACRQAVIARYFGERLPVRACGVCDHCRPDASTAPYSRRKPRPARVRDAAVVRETILACLGDLSYGVGVSGLIRILRGSVDVAPRGMRSPHYGALAGVGQARLVREIEALIAEGILEPDVDAQYPLVRMRSHGA